MHLLYHVPIFLWRSGFGGIILGLVIHLFLRWTSPNVTLKEHGVRLAWWYLGYTTCYAAAFMIYGVVAIFWHYVHPVPMSMLRKGWYEIAFATLLLAAGLGMHVWLWRQYPGRLVLRFWEKKPCFVEVGFQGQDETIWPPPPEHPGVV